MDVGGRERLHLSLKYGVMLCPSSLLVVLMMVVVPAGYLQAQALLITQSDDGRSPQIPRSSCSMMLESVQVPHWLPAELKLDSTTPDSPL